MSFWIKTDSLIIPVANIKRIQKIKKNSEQQLSFDFATCQPVKITSAPRESAKEKYILVTTDDTVIDLSFEDFVAITKQTF